MQPSVLPFFALVVNTGASTIPVLESVSSFAFFAFPFSRVLNSGCRICFSIRDKNMWVYDRKTAISIQ
ncbi:hypothetical protein CDAR_28591 [Caerostris darwini]|uniref:Secreted protein n=1 Tax=Caerostris darwini TaxID=1538125 RepID=A0AAV4Q1X5_9ARAC|nr:hypothetical protein CDAR_28591 [Caerostris darwini]